MLARAAWRILSVFCAMLYFVAGVSGAKGGGGDPGVRKHITSTLLAAVSSGYPNPPPSVTAVRHLSGGAGMGRMKPYVAGKASSRVKR